MPSSTRRRSAVVLGRLERVTKPTITQVEGFATGRRLRHRRDVRSEHRDRRFVDRHSDRAHARQLASSTGTFARLVDLIGPPRAKEMLFTGRLIPAPEAQAIGLINRVVPKEIDRGGGDGDWRARLPRNAPLTIRATKEMTRRMLDARRPDRERRGSDRDVLHERRLQGRRHGVPVQTQAPVDRRIAAAGGKALGRSWRDGDPGRRRGRHLLGELPLGVHQERADGAEHQHADGDHERQLRIAWSDR